MPKYIRTLANCYTYSSFFAPSAEQEQWLQQETCHYLSWSFASPHPVEISRLLAVYRWSLISQNE